jgi:hypothetical protein
MKTKYKIALVIIILAVVAAAVVLVILKREKKTCDESSGICPTNLATATPNAGLSASVTAAASQTPDDWRVYKNTDYNFELTFSDVWKGYEVKKSTPTDQAEAKIEFVLNGKYIPLTLLVYKTDVWNNTLRDVNHANILGQSGDYIIIYQTWDTPPPELAQITEKEIAAVAKTFKFK